KGWKRFQKAKAKLDKQRANQEKVGSNGPPCNFDAQIVEAYRRKKLRVVSEQSDDDLRQQLLNPTPSEWPEHVDQSAKVMGFGLYECDFDGPLPITTFVELAEWVNDHLRHFESLVRRKSPADAVKLAKVVVCHGCYWLSFLTGKTEVPPSAIDDEDKARSE